uniref:Uncharacterized protein n=1 Tax=Catharus ustulatus TaxID=91951 RepID=A0A8C3VCA1_CATUS
MGTWHRAAILELGLVLPGVFVNIWQSSLVEKRPFRLGFWYCCLGLQGVCPHFGVTFLDVTGPSVLDFVLSCEGAIMDMSF